MHSSGVEMTSDHYACANLMKDAMYIAAIISLDCVRIGKRVY